MKQLFLFSLLLPSDNLTITWTKLEFSINKYRRDGKEAELIGVWYVLSTGITGKLT